MSLDQVLSLLPSLTTQELGVVKQRASILLSVSGGAVKGQGSPDKPGGSSTTYDVVLDVIAEVCRAFASDYSSTHRLKRSDAYPSFKEKVDALQPYLKQVDANRVSFRAFLRVAIELLHRDLTRMGVDATARMMMLHIQRVPAVVNRHFPGYAAAGLLGWIIQKESRNGNGKSRV